MTIAAFAIKLLAAVGLVTVLAAIGFVAIVVCVQGLPEHER